MKSKKSSPWKSIRTGLAVLLVLVVYAYGFEITDIDLEQLRSDVEQQLADGHLAALDELAASALNRLTDALAELRRVDAQLAKHEARTAEQASEIAEVLGKTVLRFEVKAGPTGSLFGSVTPSDVADEIWRARKVRVDRRKISIDPIKRIGRYSIPIEVFQGVDVEVKTLVVPEGGELPPEEELGARGGGS
jgi:large subunit ribosomal protein L9